MKILDCKKAGFAPKADGLLIPFAARSMRHTQCRFLYLIPSVALPFWPFSANASDIWITGDRTITSGTEITDDRIILDGGHLRYGGGGSATLVPVLRILDNGSGSVSAADGTEFTVEFETRPVSGDIIFGSASDSGHVIVSDFRSPGGVSTYADLASLTIAGGKVTFQDAPTNYFGPISIAAGAEFVSSSFAFAARNLTGAGTIDMSGNGLSIVGGSFNGIIENVSQLTVSRQTFSDVGTIGSALTLHATLTGIDTLSVSNGIYVDAAGGNTALSLADIGSVYLGTGSTLDFGVNDVQLNDLSGSGYIGTAGYLTVNGGIFDTTLLGRLIFEGTTEWSGIMDGGSSVEVTSGSTLTTSNASVFATTIPALTVNGVHNLAESAAVGSLTGTGAVVIADGKTLSTGNANTDSTFSGNISGQGGLVKQGTATLTLAGTSTYAGGTLISGGTLKGTTTSLRGDMVNNGSLLFDQASNGIFAGDVSGSGSLTKAGAGTVTLSGNNTYTGGTVLTGGQLLGDTMSLFGAINNGATLVFNQTFDGSYLGALSGSGQLVKTGAAKLSFDGISSFNGTTEVLDGIFAVNGSLAGSVTVRDGGRLGGNGTIGGFSIDGGGTLGPGNSIGTLSVSGNASFLAGSTYEVEVDAAGASDLLLASGTLFISPSASVFVTSESGLDNGAGFSQSRTYTIATATGGISGTFGSVTDDFAYLVPTLSYGATDVYLTMTRESFTSTDNSAQDNAVAEAIEGLGPGLLYDALLFVSNDERNRALQDLAGELHPSLQRALADTNRLGQHAITEHLREREGRNFFISNTIAQTDYDATTDAYGLSQSSQGIYWGVDLITSEGMRGGVMAGYTRNETSLEGGRSSAEVDSVHIGLYGASDFGPLTVRYGGILSNHDISTKRHVQFSTLSDNLTADYRSLSAHAYLEAAHSFGTETSFLEPFVGFSATAQSAHSFEESGGAAALNGDTDSFETYRTSLGLRVSNHLETPIGEANIFGAVAFEHSTGSLGSSANVAFDGTNPFLVTGIQRDTTTASVKGGIDLLVSDKASLSLSYEGRFGPLNSASSLNSKLSIRF